MERAAPPGSLRGGPFGSTLQAVSTLSVASRVTKNKRALFDCTEAFWSANGFSSMSRRRTAARKNCLARPHQRRTVLSARGFDFRFYVGTRLFAFENDVAKPPSLTRTTRRGL